MNSEIKIDILFAGLLLIPIIVLAAPYIKNRLVELSQGRAFTVFSLPISAYLIYDISPDSNVFGLIGLSVAYFVFFSKILSVNCANLPLTAFSSSMANILISGCACLVCFR